VIRLFLRRHVTGLVINMFLGIATALAQTVTFGGLAGDTLARRHAFAQQMDLLGQQISYLLPLPKRVENLWAYYQWRGVGGALLVMTGWAVVSATGATRGEEEKGLVEEWLAAGINRAKLLFTRFGIFLLCAAAVITAFELAAAAGGAREAGGIPWAGLALQGLALLALVAVCYALSMLVAQFSASRRGAGALAGGAVALLFFANSFSRTLDGLRSIRGISPFYYYDLTDALVPGGSFNAVATGAMLLAAILMVAIAAAVFERRDLGAVPFQRPPKPRAAELEPNSAATLRNSVAEALWERRFSLLAWTLAAVALAGFLASFIRPTRNLMSSNPALQRYLASYGPRGADGAFLQALWFSTAELVLAGFTILEVARWTADDEEGRLEMLLSTPFARWRVVVERFVTLAVQLAVLVGFSCTAAALLASSQGLTFSRSDLVLASLLLLPLALAFGAIGAVLSGLAPRLAVPILGLLAVLSYLLLQLGPVLNWPEAVNNLSLFRLYGTPMTSGVYWTGLYTLVAICLVGFGAGVVVMERREVGS